MASERAGPDASDGIATVVVAAAADAPAGAFERRLAASDAIERVETAAPDAVADVLDAAGADCVVCLPPPGGDRNEGAAATADDGDDAGALVAAVADAGTAAPVLVVGTGLDAAAAYAAGATELLPVDPREEAGGAVDRIAAVVSREAHTAGRERTIDPTADVREETERILARIDEAFLALGDDWRVGYLNERAGDLFGVDPETAVGRVVWEAIPAVADTAIERKARNAMETRYPLSVEAELPALDGWFEIDVYPDEEGLSVFVAETTERRERERELRVRKRAMAEASIPLTLADPSRPDNPLVYVNEAFEELTGYDREEALGRNCRFLQGPETDPETVAEIAAAVDAEETIRTEVLNYRKDGTPFRNRLDVTPIYDENGRLLRFLGSQRDVTEQHRRRNVRENLLATTRELLNAGSRAEIAEITSDAARSVLGHDLNAVYLRANGDGPLSPAAWTDDIDELFDGPREPAPGGPVVEAFDRGEATIVDDLAARTDDPGGGEHPYAPAESLLSVPLGDHGVLVVGETDAESFDAADIGTGELLTLNAAAALDRMARVRELQEYETLFETVQDKLYVVDEEGYVQRVTEPLADALGYDCETLCGRHVSTVLTEKTVEEGERLVSDLLVTPEPASNRYEGTMIDRDGEERPVEIELSLLPHGDDFRGTVGAVRDISERRSRERELRVFRRAVIEAGIGLAMYGDDGRFSYVNEQYASLLGYERTELESTPVWRTFEGVTAETFGEFWNGFAPGETRTTETESRRADGTTVSVETVTTAVTIDDERYHIDTVQEITGRRERRQQTEVLHRLLRHNLRNELTVVRAHASRLVGGLDDEIESAETIVETVERLADLVDTARNAERVVERETVRRPIDVCELLREEIADLRAAADATVEATLPEARYVAADPLFGEAIGQLLDNAVEHNDAADPEVSVAVSEMPDRSGWVAVEIADNGPGIPEQERAVLTAGEETPLRHGSGIGLWIVRWIVARYGGDLRFETREPRGSRVVVALPTAEAPAEDETVTDDDPAADRRTEED